VKFRFPQKVFRKKMAARLLVVSPAGENPGKAEKKGKRAGAAVPALAHFQPNEALRARAALLQWDRRHREAAVAWR